MNDIEKFEDRLSEITKQNAFRTPDNYFEDFPGKMRDRIARKVDTEGKNYLLPPRYKIRLAIAATIISLTVVGYITAMLIFSDRSGHELAAPEIAEYIEYFSSDLDESQYYEFLEDPYESESLNSSYEDLVIDYLIDQNIDYQSIAEEL